MKETHMADKRVLIVDDETAFLVSIRKILQGPDLLVDTAETFNEARSLIDCNDYTTVITDIRLTDVSSREGMEILRYVKERRPETRVILLTGYGSPEIMEKAYAMGASNYLEKPLSASILKNILNNEVAA
jgi:DNA-binding NtrC family response regulator